MEEQAKTTHWYLHVDQDAFFASVEQLDNPELRGKPVIVGGKPDDRRSVVSTASYEARAFGVHSAMPTFQAYKLCPQGIFVHGRMQRYAELSHQIMNIFRDYSPDVDQMSIDEAFIDLTGTEKLFGPPQETAHAIKARVKKETGLTVSVGLATTKYLAKISSGLSKPDGFFQIKAGEEEKFMLNLPLNKVWGLGPKSLELIRSKGFNSTRDIYERDYDTLEFLFGKNMAGFLYNVVRGIEKESFSRESKSHSISAETTFPYDLTDIYMIETELLELAQGVFFRLLKEEGYSRTAFVKIRYDDFSTGTVQETVERNIITLDSFYEIIKRLFEKRYQNGRGIRLLGVGFENIVKEEKPYQQDLFSTNNDEKKQAVEKAILKLSKKHPEIKVSKARTLKALLFALLIGALPAEAKTQEKVKAREETKSKESVSLFDYDINDKNHVDFSASGLWKMEFTAGFDLSFGNGTSFAFSPSVPVFKQETDLSALLTINNHWYFEAAFAEEFSRNTFAFGYKGDNIIRHFRLSNRGITMNKGYSAEHFGYALQGGNNQAPGMFLQLTSPSEKIKAEFLVRYDITETKSEIYYGMNRVSDIKIPAEDFAYGREFHFPQAASQFLYEIENIYIENKAGTYTDGRGKNYRRLRKDEYSIVLTAQEPRLYISYEAGGGKNSYGEIPSILVTFTLPQNAQTIVTAAGSWTDTQSFLGKIQTELGAGGKYNLDDYDYDEKLTTIEGQAALIIQNYNGFSSFLCPLIYDSGLNRKNKAEADYLVIADKSEIPVAKYSASQTYELYTGLLDNFFESEPESARVSNKDNPESLYPFAEDCPEIYLGLAQTTDLSVRARTYSPVTQLVISKKAAAGTVQVYKNGILLTGTSYNENTGVIELNQSVSEADQLLITWQEENSDFSSGAIAAAAGLKFDILPELSADLSLTTRLPVSPNNSYAATGSQKSSFTALSAGINYEKYGLILTEKSAVSLLNDNTATGLLLYYWTDVWDSYLKEKASNPDKIIKEPDMVSTVSFSPQDFSPYKKIVTSVNFKNKTDDAFQAPLTLILDQDTGTKNQGDPAIYLEVTNLSAVTEKESLHTVTILTDSNEVYFDETLLSQNDYTLTINKAVIPSRLILELPASSGEDQQALIEKLTFNDAVNYGTAKNYAAVKYKNEKSLLSAGDFDLIKDLDLSLESDQGSGNFLSPEPYVSLKTKASMNLAGIKFSGDAAIQNFINSAQVSEAGHSIKTDENLFIFKIISAEDTFRYKTFSNELRKENAFALDFSPLKVNLKAGLKTSAFDAAYNSKQSSEINASFTQKIKSSEFGISTKFSASQKFQQQKNQLPSYAESWYKVSALAFSDGKDSASNRNILMSASLNGIFSFEKSKLTFKPKLSYEISDIYTLASNSTQDNTLFTDKEKLSLQLPFSLDKKTLTFEISRSGSGSETMQAGGNYKSDASRLFALQNNRSWFYTSIPFYELFDPGMKEKLSSGTSYSAKYEGNFRRSLYNSKKDIFIPSSLTLALSREIKKQTPLSDLYQIKLVLTNNSVNNFGSNSAGKQFSWFNQEELSTSLTALFKIPRDDPGNLKINIQAYAQLLLFISTKSIVTEQFNFSFEDAGNWNVRNTLSYSRPSKSSLITSAALLLIPQAKSTSYEISRKDSFTAEIGRSDALLKQKYSYTHTVGIDFLEYYNVNAGLGGTLILNQKAADRFNLNLTLGAKAEF